MKRYANTCGAVVTIRCQCSGSILLDAWISITMSWTYGITVLEAVYSSSNESMGVLYADWERYLVCSYSKDLTNECDLWSPLGPK